MVRSAKIAGAGKERSAPLAYLVSQYPAVNHTFILREIRGLRELGLDVRVASILGPDRPPERMSAEEREEMAATFYIRPAGLGSVIGACARAFFTRPAGFCKGAVLAIRLSRWSLLALLRHLRCLTEAAAAGLWMHRQAAGRMHTHFASTPALLVSAMFGIEFSATIHGPDEFTDPSGFLLPEKVAAARFIVAISSYGRSQLMRVSRPCDWDKLGVARLGVDTREFAPEPRIPDSGNRGRAFELISVGRLAPVKAQRLLLEACSLLAAKQRRILLRLVGDGPLRGELEQAAVRLGLQDGVVFHGALSHDRVLELYRSADAFALASFAEGIPVVLMEAMALAIPCVATWVMGVPELIRDREEGLLVAPSDVNGLADAIERLMDDPSLRTRLGAAGREKVLREYDLRRNVASLADFFLHSNHGGMGNGR